MIGDISEENSFKDPELINLTLLVETIVNYLPTKIFSLAPLSYKNLEYIELYDFDNGNNDLNFEFFEEKISTRIDICQKRENIIDLYDKLITKDNGDHDIIIKNLSKFTKEYISMLSSDINKYILYSHNISTSSYSELFSCGIFIWNHFKLQPVFYSKYVQPKIEYGSKFIPVSEILNNRVQTHPQRHFNEQNNHNAHHISKLVILKKDYKQNEIVYEKAVSKYNFNKIFELFCMNFNLAIIYLKKYIITLKSLFLPKGSDLLSEILNNNTKSGDNSDDHLYKKLIGYLHMKAKNCISNCINLLKNMTKEEELYLNDIFKYNSHKFIINVSFLHSFINNILNFFGQIVVCLKVLLKKKDDKDPKIVFFMLKNIWYIRYNIMAQKEFTQSYQFLFNSVNMTSKSVGIDVIFSVITNVFISYLYYTKYFSEKKYGDITTFCVEAIHFMEKAKNECEPISSHKNCDKIMDYIKSTLKNMKTLNNNVFHQKTLTISDDQFMTRHSSILKDMQENLRFDLKYLMTPSINTDESKQPISLISNSKSFSSIRFTSLNIANLIKSPKLIKLDNFIRERLLNNPDIDKLPKDYILNILISEIKILEIDNNDLIQWLSNNVKR
jgi:hypothetical protein